MASFLQVRVEHTVLRSLGAPWITFYLILLCHLLKVVSSSGKNNNRKDGSDVWYELWYFWLIIILFLVGAIILMVVYCKQHAKNARINEFGRRVNHQMVLPPAPPDYNEPGHEPPPYHIAVTHYDYPPPPNSPPLSRPPPTELLPTQTASDPERPESVPPPYSPTNFLAFLRSMEPAPQLSRIASRQCCPSYTCTPGLVNPSLHQIRTPIRPDTHQSCRDDPDDFDEDNNTSETLGYFPTFTATSRGRGIENTAYHNTENPIRNPQPQQATAGPRRNRAAVSALQHTLALMSTHRTSGNADSSASASETTNTQTAAGCSYNLSASIPPQSASVQSRRLRTRPSEGAGSIGSGVETVSSNASTSIGHATSTNTNTRLPSSVAKPKHMQQHPVPSSGNRPGQRDSSNGRAAGPEATSHHGARVTGPTAARRPLQRESRPSHSQTNSATSTRLKMNAK